MTGWTAGRAAALSAAVAATLAAGCTAGSSGSSPAPTSSSPPATSSSPAPSTSATTSTGAHSTLLFVFENHSRSQIMRDTCATGTHKEPGALLDTCMPYLNSLGQQYGQDTAYENTGSPSLPNYLSFWGDSTFGVPDDHPPSYHPIAGDSVGDEALAAGKTVKAYEESMPSNCKLSAYNHLYFPKHNPWAYFNGTTQRHNCNTFDVPMGTTSSGAFASDIVNGKLPTIGYAVGNVCNDGHNDNSTANPPNCYPRTISDPPVVQGLDDEDFCWPAVAGGEPDRDRHHGRGRRGRRRSQHPVRGDRQAACWQANQFRGEPLLAVQVARASGGRHAPAQRGHRERPQGRFRPVSHPPVAASATAPNRAAAT